MKTERGGKGIWYAKEPDGDRWRGFRASIACQTLLPGKAIVCSLGTGKGVEPAKAEPVELFQQVRYRRVGGAGASRPLADESIAASLPKGPDEEPMEEKIPLAQGRTHLRPRNVKEEANRRH